DPFHRLNAMRKQKSETDEEFQRVKVFALNAANSMVYGARSGKHDPENEATWNDPYWWHPAARSRAFRLSVQVELEHFSLECECEDLIRNSITPDQIEGWYLRKLIDRNISPETFSQVLPALR